MPKFWLSSGYAVQFMERKQGIEEAGMAGVKFSSLICGAISRVLASTWRPGSMGSSNRNQTPEQLARDRIDRQLAPDFRGFDILKRANHNG